MFLTFDAPINSKLSFGNWSIYESFSDVDPSSPSYSLPGWGRREQKLQQSQKRNGGSLCEQHVDLRRAGNSIYHFFRYDPTLCILLNQSGGQHSSRQSW